MPCSSKSVTAKASTISKNTSIENTDKTNLIEWYRRICQTSEWQKFPTKYAEHLEKAFSEHPSKGQLQRKSAQIYFDEPNELLIDFNKMVVSPLESNHIILFHLKRRHTVLGRFVIIIQYMI